MTSVMTYYFKNISWCVVNKSWRRMTTGHRWPRWWIMVNFVPWHTRRYVSCLNMYLPVLKSCHWVSQQSYHIISKVWAMLWYMMFCIGHAYCCKIERRMHTSSNTVYLMCMDINTCILAHIMYRMYYLGIWIRVVIAKLVAGQVNHTGAS